MWFYVDKDRQQRGPVSVDELKRLLGTGEITRRTHLWQEGRAAWVRLEDLAAELGIGGAPPPTPAPTMIMQPLAQPMQPPVQIAPQPMQPVPQPMQAPMQAMPPMQQPVAPPFAVPPPGYAPQPAFPQMGVPVQSASRGLPWMKIILGLVGVIALLARFGHHIPALADEFAKQRMKSLAEGMASARDQIAKFSDANGGTCPGEKDSIAFEVDGRDKEVIKYGHMEADNACVTWVDFEKGYRLPPLEGHDLTFIRREGKWICGSTADAKYLPAGCEHYDPQ